MKVHEQKADKARHPFWDLVVTDNGDGTISIPVGKFYMQGKEYDLSAITNEPFPDGSKLSVEKVGSDADYLVDTTGLAEPVSFGEGIGAVLVVWHEGGEIHHLRSIQK